ncbi:MAG TPA: hypothetical protein VG457_13645 [Planctomycetota bacterium]|jgi:hypothetical protein|nr:hypothetical protein [Planctomycetota bacterium]
MFMLTKIESRVVRQPDSKMRRAWYQSAAAEVILYHDADTGAFLSFEIDFEGCAGVRRAYVSWARGIGVRTGSVNVGDEGGPCKYKASPVVIWDFKNRPRLIDDARRLVEASSIEEGLRDSILRRLTS